LEENGIDLFQGKIRNASQQVTAAFGYDWTLINPVN
jgi:hypothetical protein